MHAHKARDVVAIHQRDPDLTSTSVLDVAKGWPQSKQATKQQKRISHSIQSSTFYINATNTMIFRILALFAVGASAFAPQPFVANRAATALFGVEDQVTEIIVSQLSCDPEKVVPGATFVDDLGADSLDTVELIMAIEEEFDCEIPEEEAASISTVQEVIDYVAKL